LLSLAKSGEAALPITFPINLTLMDWRYNTIWFDQIKTEDQLTWHFDRRNNGPLQLGDKHYLTTWHFKRKGERSFDTLPLSANLLYLELNSANVIDFQGIERFPGLKRLEVHYCLKLESDAGIAALKDSLEILHIRQSKKIRGLAEIAHLSGLKVLRLNSCGSLPNIRFIKDLPNLLDFRFVDTSILDGDLTPILEHPTLRSVGFLNKRHYNYSSEKIDAILRPKAGDETKDFVYKGEYQTFKFKEMN
jgi:hypothetical protein